MDQEDNSHITSDQGPDLDTDFAIDGDLILIVGPEKARLRVHSKCLRVASDVFDAMFGENWSEGQGLSTQAPKEIVLDDDNAFAMRTICLILHHSPGVPEVLSGREMAIIAIVADKYDLANALRYANTCWLKQKGTTDLLDKEYRMLAAILSKDTHMCAMHTTDLIEYWNQPYMSLLDDGLIAQFISLKAIYLLEQRRNQMRLELAEFLETELKRLSAATCTNSFSDCPWAKKRREAYASLASRVFSGPTLLKSSLSTIIKEIKNATFEDGRPFTCAARYG